MTDQTRLPDDVKRLVIAARRVAFEDRGPESIRELDEASEAFADRVKWDGDPVCESDDAEQRCADCDCWKFTRETCS